MRSKALFVVALVCFGAVSGFAQATPPKNLPPAKIVKLPTVKEILEKYVAALGGREVIQKIKSRTALGTIELVEMNLKGTFESFAAPEFKSYTKSTIAGVGDFYEGSDENGSWAINPLQGSRDKSGVESIQSKLLNDFYREIRLEKLFPKMELKGVEKVGEREAYVITASADGVPPETWYFDKETGLMLRSDILAATPEGSQPMTFFYEDMRRVDGMLIPFRVRSKTPSYVILLTSTEVKQNVPFDAKVFSKPK